MVILSMHILFVTGEYPPMQGGVGAYTEALALELAGLGCTISVLTSRLSTDVLSPSDLSSHHTFGDSLGDTSRGTGPAEGSHADYLVMPTDKDTVSDEAVAANRVSLHREVSRWGWQTCRQIVDFAQEIQADWIHVQYQTAAFGMNPSINFAPQFWNRSSLPHICWTYHDLLVPYLFPKAGNRLRTWVTERPAHFARTIITTNSMDAQQLQRRGLSPYQIPIGSNIHGYELKPEQRRARRALRGYNDENLVIGYFGFLNRSKGGITLVQTLYRLQQERSSVRLLIIGEQVGASDPTNYAYLQEVKNLINDLALADSVQWTGEQSDPDVGADLNACDLLLMPYEDGASLRRGTLMAGLTNGCAIVTTEPKEPIPEFIDGEQLLYVPPGNADEAARRIKFLADNVTVSERMRQNAREVSRLFSWQSIVAKHIEIYQT